ncbi:flagellar hook-length control protein FliK [Paraglaciecola psychrophila]|uniref:Flagellar hook-length control protein-like protein n=1 Tax=Paraglaciecola psychrophila 170 TaxID=1129794 RepID=K6ZQV4_9ALTE|nr:flagellar hook-length control protein FliK [Paraglaciecola psychrophila]AGH45772.1 flagellar hook-length control protein-like protein [Paraglaciecola psychrophila 170]GAC38291.1 flagellar hook-length control protein FliK [Paraglaciecola psychrophila 170]
MMQHVATAKSEVAAFDSCAHSNSFKGSESNEQFGKLLQDQKSSHTLADAPPPHSPRKRALQQSIDETQEDINNKHLKTHAESNVADQRNYKFKNGDAEAELQLVSPSKQNASISDVEAADVAAQEWMSLVDNLQKLANIARSTKQSLADVETESLVVSVADLILSDKVDSGLLEQVAELHTIGDINAAPEKFSLRQTDYVDENTVAPVLKDTDPLALLIQNALEKLTAKSETDQVLSSDMQQKVAQSLLEQSGVLQNLMLANQPVETSLPVDLRADENKNLLKTLLVDAETDIASLQQTIKSAQLTVSDTADRLVQAQHAQTLITKLESVAEQSKLLEQDARMASGNLLNLGKVENVTRNNDIKNILNLTDSKLDKVLENIAQRVFDSKKTDEAINPEHIAQQLVIPKAADIISSVESSSKEFVSALKSGIEEYKNQLSQGREPGIDLKALISEALAKSTESGVLAKAPVNLEQIVSSVSQVLDFAQTMNRAIEHHHDQIYSATLRDAAQVQGEQSKQIQLNQFESKFEKAINIAKPEGHLQLAEKVRWMVNTKNLVAEIRLDPAELGSVYVKVAVSGESATVNFVVQSQQARDAVDTATPRLREMFAEKGIELGQSSVRQESDNQQSQGDAESANQGGSNNDDAEDVSEQVLGQHNIVNGALGGIDYFV